jgi:hypothetical protein
MQHLTSKLLIAAITCFFLFTSCKKFGFDKIAEGSWNPNFAVPVAHANFGVYDILASQDSSDLVVIDPNTGAIALVYKGEILTIDAGVLLNIQDENESLNLDATDLNAIPAPIFNGSVTSNNNQNFVFDAGTSELHQVTFKSGNLDINVSTDLAHDITCVITFPELKKNGIPVSTTVSLNYSGNVPQSDNASVDLLEAIGDFTLGNTTFNQLDAEISITINGTGQPITGTEDIDIEFAFSNLDFKNAKGYFGQNNLGISGDSVLLRLFQNANNGYFELIDPKITFFAENTFGFPIRMNFSNLKTVNVNNGNEIFLSGFPSVFDIPSATSIGQTSFSQFDLNTTNTTNLSTIVSSVPKFFVYTANVVSNPDGNIPPLNFISEKSQMKIRTEVELPMEGLAYGFELRDTVDFNFNEDLSQLESVMFRLNIDNGFPVELKSQITFLDDNYNPIFSTFNTPESVVSPALVDNNGRVNQRIKKITDINLTQDQILLLSGVKYVLLNAVAQTLDGTNGQVIKLFDDYTLDFKLGLQVQGKINL